MAKVNMSHAAAKRPLATKTWRSTRWRRRSTTLRPGSSGGALVCGCGRCSLFSPSTAIGSSGNAANAPKVAMRSEERRVGKEGSYGGGPAEQKRRKNMREQQECERE